MLTFEPLEPQFRINGHRPDRPYTSLTGRNRSLHEPLHLPFIPGPEDSPNDIFFQILPSDEFPSPADSSPWTDPGSDSQMRDYSHHNQDAAIRVTPPNSGSNIFPTSCPSNDPSTSTSTRSGSNYSGPDFPVSNMMSPSNFRDQSNPPHCSFDPVQTFYSPLPYGQPRPRPRPRHQSSPTQRARFGHNARENNVVSSSQYQHSNHPEHQLRNQGHLSSDLLGSPDWSTATNFGSGRSLSASQVAGTDSRDSYIPDYTDGRSSGYGASHTSQSYRHYRDDPQHDADDEGSDAMSDGIASDEGVYSPSESSDRDVFDDEDGDSSEDDSEEEYDSDEYSDT